MKVLYIKNNSERNRAFQVRTTIYEDNGNKYVKKEALTTEAIPHIQKMKQSFQLLQKHTQEGLVPVTILQDDEKNIVFRFLEGESFEQRFVQAQANPEKIKELFSQYTALLEKSFKLTQFDHKSMINDEWKQLFGDMDYSIFDGQRCFDGVCNLDMILSNLIEVSGEEKIYFIDYEWTFTLNIPFEYIIYRTYNLLPKKIQQSLELTFEHAPLYDKMERHFIDSYVMNRGFYFQKNQYMQINTPIAEHIRIKEEHNQQLEAHVDHLAEEIKSLQKVFVQLDEAGEALEYAQSVIELRDKQIEYFQLGNRIKNFIKRCIPGMKATQLPTQLNRKEQSNKNQKKYTYTQPSFSNSIQTEIQLFEKKPLISLIMPVYNVAPKWLEKAIDSVEAQWYENWELCIADDKSTNNKTVEFLQQLNNPKVKTTFLKENLNISGASNAALELAEGEYIVLMDNDDEITPDALYEVVKRINQTDAEFIYSDEDFISPDEEYINPHFKPDFSPDLLLSHNYITHLSCFKRSLLDSVGHFNPKYDGAQDYELFLRLTEKANKVEHIQKVLYHWRMLESSTSLNSKAKPEALERGRELLEETLQRRGVDGEVLLGNMDHYFHVKYTIKDEPLVSIIIPFKDKPELLRMSINSILEKSSYKNFEIIGISNNSEEDTTFSAMKELEQKDSRVHFYEYNVPFNYAQINNYAVESYAKGEHILLLNNDIEIISPDWIESMLEHSQREEIGCVGAKLYYPDDTIQHAGIIIGLGGYAGHSHKMYPRNNPGYFNRLNVIQDLSAVTAACLMIKKRLYKEIDGMDEIKFKVAYNDVDFCLRVAKAGYYNLFTPYAEMYHHESVSRGYETTPEKIARFQTEKDALYERHKDILDNGDPYYNPNLCDDKEDFSICPKS